MVDSSTRVKYYVASAHGRRFRLPDEPRGHAAVFIHRVEQDVAFPFGVFPGLYTISRNIRAWASFTDDMQSELVDAAYENGFIYY